MRVTQPPALELSQQQLLQLLMPAQLRQRPQRPRGVPPRQPTAVGAVPLDQRLHQEAAVGDALLAEGFEDVHQLRHRHLLHQRGLPGRQPLSEAAQQP